MAVPAILLTWTGGALADRVDRRKLLMAASVATTALLVLQAALDLSGVVTVWQVLTIAVLLGLVGGLEWPAMQALIPSLVAREHLMSAVAMNAIVWQSTRMVIPALGGIAIALWDTGVLFLAAVAGPLSMLAVLCFLDVGAGARSRSPRGGAFAEALQFILRHRLFAVLIPLSWAAGFFGSSYLQLMPVFADLLGAGGAGFGALMSASGAGSVLGSLLVGSLSATPRLGRVMLGSLVAAGTGIFVFALIAGFANLLPSAFHAGLICVALTNLFISIFMVTSMTALQLRCPDSHARPGHGAPRRRLQPHDPRSAIHRRTCVAPRRARLPRGRRPDRHAGRRRRARHATRGPSPGRPGRARRMKDRACTPPPNRPQ